MSARPSNHPSEIGHPSWRIVLHWTTVLLIVAGIALIFAREAVEDRHLREVLLALHRTCGLSVLVLVAFRIAAAPWMRTAAEDMSAWATWSARFLHAALYGVLVAAPIVGWALSSARGQAVTFVDLLPLPPLAGRDRDLAEQLEEVHEVMAYTLMGFAFLHAAAALWHHYRRRDRVLVAMLPRFLRPAPDCSACDGSPTDRSRPKEI